MDKHREYLTDPVGYLHQATGAEKDAYYMGYEHGKQQTEKGIVSYLHDKLNPNNTKGGEDE